MHYENTVFLHPKIEMLSRIYYSHNVIYYGATLALYLSIRSSLISLIYYKTTERIQFIYDIPASLTYHTLYLEKILVALRIRYLPLKLCPKLWT